MIDLAKLHQPMPVPSRARELLQLADTACARHPEIAPRMSRAADLLLDGHVAELSFRKHLFVVHAQFSPSHDYTVDTEGLTCTCPDWSFGTAPEVSGHRLCKHLLACLLLEAAR